VVVGGTSFFSISLVNGKKIISIKLIVKKLLIVAGILRGRRMTGDKDSYPNETNRNQANQAEGECVSV